MSKDKTEFEILDTIGKTCWFKASNSGVYKGQIMIIKHLHKLNTGDDRYGKLLPKETEYFIEFGTPTVKEWVSEEHVVFDQENVWQLL